MHKKYRLVGGAKNNKPLVKKNIIPEVPKSEGKKILVECIKIEKEQKTDKSEYEHSTKICQKPPLEFIFDESVTWKRVGNTIVEVMSKVQDIIKKIEVDDKKINMNDSPKSNNYKKIKIYL